MITLFLDIDGVIATPLQWNLNRKAKSWIQDYNIYPFDPKAVKILNELLTIKKTKIVIHSDWVYHYDLAQLQDIFRINNVKQVPEDITGMHYVMDPLIDRIRRIENYIKDKGVNNYYILDDVDISTRVFKDRFIHVPRESEGLKQSGLKEKIIKKLETFS